MTRPLRRLEDFGDAARGRLSDAERAQQAAVATARGEGHAAGYAEGFAAALEQADNEDRAVLGALREAVRDLELERAALRAELVAGLRPVVEALARAVLPVAAELGLAAELAEAVAAGLGQQSATALQVHVAPVRVAALADRLGPGLAVLPDPALSPLAARIGWAGGGACFDADAATAAALAAVERFFEGVADRKSSHG